jgi:hypothetical protein
MTANQRKWTYERIEELTSTAEPESQTLDYKREVNEKNRAKLARSVSAFANSQGGTLLIGVAEQKGRPVHPPAGIPRMLGNQKIEEWVEQVLSYNISPRVPARIEPVDHPSDPDRCFVVIDVSQSAQAPHMVMVDGDNRYYRRIFRRDQFESRPAEEYEVRDMFHRSTRYRAERAEFLLTRGIGRDPGTTGDYAMNTLTSRLRLDEVGHTVFAMLSACPDGLVAGAIPVTSDVYWSWVSGRHYPPARMLPWLPYDSRPVANGALHYDQDAKGRYRRYVLVRDTGYVEVRMVAARYDNERSLKMFRATELMARYSQLVSFAVDLYEQFRLYWEFDVGLHLAGTSNSVLCDLGEGWQEPESQPEDELSRCLDGNVEISFRFPSFDVGEEVLEEGFRSVAEQLDHAYGSRWNRIFNSPHSRNPGRFRFELSRERD